MSDSPKKQPDRKPPTHIEIFYGVQDQSYWYRLNGRFLSMKKSDLRMHLYARGLSDREEHRTPDGRIREIDYPLWAAQNERAIDYAGPLAGHRLGTFRDGSNRMYLVTEEARGVWEPLAKPQAVPEFFQAFIEELLPEGQAEYLCQWLAIAVRSLRKGDFAPGQAVVLAGPAGCGKSLLQNIITEILGGRAANPFRYMMEKTDFNYDLAGAEHWMIEDPASTTDTRTRRMFGNRLKEAVANRDYSVHPKHKDALTLYLLRRVTISVNDEPENLAVVPPLDDSIADKVFLFLCTPVTKAFTRFRQKNGELDRAALWAHVQSEIPAVRAWLLQTFKAVPPKLRDDRFGIRAWHHPKLTEELMAQAPETRLLQLIDQILWDPKALVPWTGKAIELEGELRKHTAFGFECDKVLRSANSCGTYLGRLSKHAPERVSKRVKDGYTAWSIQPPPSMQPREL